MYCNITSHNQSPSGIARRCYVSWIQALYHLVVPVWVAVVGHDEDREEDVHPKPKQLELGTGHGNSANSTDDDPSLSLSPTST